MTGRISNAITVLIGGILGTILGLDFPESLQETFFSSLGLFTTVIALDRVLLSKNFLIVLGSLFLGALIGKGLHIEDHLENFGVQLRDKLVKSDDGVANARFIVGFVTASGQLGGR